ncbi:MAG TPA: hypothetical protein EYP41_08380 [Anaerolineae bacterium]|nr:hypothetical protein [Anaerolineae bacterium]
MAANKSTNFYEKVAFKFWPELAESTPETKTMGVMAFIPIIFLWPFALGAIIWLIAVSDWQIARNNWSIFAFLLIIQTLLQLSQFTVNFKLNQSENVPLTSSLSNIVEWAAILIFGPTVLWVTVLTSLIKAVYRGWQLSRYQNTPTWLFSSEIIQEWGVGVFSGLAAVTVYTALGGQIPFTTVTISDAHAMLLAVLIYVLLPILLLTPTIIALNQYGRTANTPNSLARFALSLSGLSFLTIPFALILAMAADRGGQSLFIFLLAAILVVNWLAYYLSRSTNKNQRLSQELAALEALSEEIIQAPADAHNLEAILTRNLPRIFPLTRYEVRVFAPPEENLWPAFHIVYPPNLPGATEADWQALAATEETTLLRPNVTLPGDKAVLGDGVMVNIFAPIDDDKGDDTAVILGGIYLLRHNMNGRTQDSLPVLQGLASQIGSALYRAQAYQESIARLKMAQELEFAGRIQASFLPKHQPEIAGWDIRAAIVPARQTSGDFYDFMEMEDGRIGLLVADVADKGTGAALYMALSRTLIRTFALQYPDQPELALQLANERILADTQSDQFVTVFYGVLHPGDGRFVYCNAGHNPAFITGSQTRALTNTGTPLGMFPGLTWRQRSVTLAPGNTLILYSDGIPEAQNVAHDEFGDDRLLLLANEYAGKPAVELEEAIKTAVTQFVGDAPQFDDITLMVAVRENQ